MSFHWLDSALVYSKRRPPASFREAWYLVVVHKFAQMGWKHPPFNRETNYSKINYILDDYARRASRFSKDHGPVAAFLFILSQHLVDISKEEQRTYKDYYKFLIREAKNPCRVLVYLYEQGTSDLDVVLFEALLEAIDIKDDYFRRKNFYMKILDDFRQYYWDSKFFLEPPKEENLTKLKERIEKVNLFIGRGLTWQPQYKTAVLAHYIALLRYFGLEEDEKICRSSVRL